jgi:hypothetical protein
MKARNTAQYPAIYPITPLKIINLAPNTTSTKAEKPWAWREVKAKVAKVNFGSWSKGRKAQKLYDISLV